MALLNHASLVIEVFSNLDTRRVIRLTLVKGYNMGNVDEYAEIIRKSNAHFVEVKAYMYVGASRERLSLKNMPLVEDIRSFSEALAEKLGWKVIGEHKLSRVCLLAAEDYSWRKLQ